jgi:hypothetical protein
MIAFDFYSQILSSTFWAELFSWLAETSGRQVASER